MGEFRRIVVDAAIVMGQPIWWLEKLPRKELLQWLEVYGQEAERMAQIRGK